MRLPQTSGVLAELHAERVRQQQKWGEQNWTNLGWLVIAAEEAGEVAKDLCEATFTLKPAYRREKLAAMRIELVQLAAVLVAWIEAFDIRILNRENIPLGGIRRRRLAGKPARCPECAPLSEAIAGGPACS